MREMKRKERLIHTIEEFEKVYLPKRTKEVDLGMEENQREFGRDLTKSIMSRINIKA